MPRKHLIVSGRVQGVGFRYYTISEAESLGVAGWVRNRSDGTVEIEAQAAAAVLDAFVEAIRRGPAFSEVDSVDETPIPESKQGAGFRLRW